MQCEHCFTELDVGDHAACMEAQWEHHLEIRRAGGLREWIKKQGYDIIKLPKGDPLLEPAGQPQ